MANEPKVLHEWSGESGAEFRIVQGELCLVSEYRTLRHRSWQPFGGHIDSCREILRLAAALAEAEERARDLQEHLDGAMSALESAEERARRARVEGMRH